MDQFHKFFFLESGVSFFRYNNKSYKIDDIDFKQDPTCSFDNARGEKQKYTDYYKKQYNIDIQDLGQPLLASRVKNRGLHQKDVEETIYLIPEVCMLTGLSDEMRADFKVRTILRS